MRPHHQDADSIKADHIRRLIRVGVALSAEKDIDRLLERLLTEARIITLADGGTLYLISENGKELQFAFVQNKTLGVNMGGTKEKMVWTPIRLTDNDGRPNHANVSAHVAITGEPINIEDVYDAPGFNFEGPRAFDKEKGYRSKSMLVLPMRDHTNDIIGVLQLLNATDSDTGQVIPFSREAEDLAMSLASQAAVALTNNLLIAELENLLDAFIKTIALTIDEKSPYTGGHVRRVADLTMRIAEKINRSVLGSYAGISFSKDELRELRMAAWLHDVGKITTPEHVVDKATKLQKVYDRIDDIKVRFELLKRDYRMEKAKQGEIADDREDEDLEREIETLEQEYQFLKQVNNETELITDSMIERIRRIAQRTWKSSSQVMPLLSEDEVLNLCIRRGTLNEKERDIVNSHADITHKILSQLPFPKKMRKIAEYASSHHEKLDGSGYPRGLKGHQLPLQSRIIALADIFEALTAEDRPYKKGKSIEEALGIMKSMVANRHIDSDLFDLFVREKIYQDYALSELSEQKKRFLKSEQSEKEKDFS